MPDGFETEITAIKDPDWESKAVTVMAGMWKKIGVKVKVNVLPAAQYWDYLEREHESVRLHCLDAPSARRHGPRPRLSHGRAVERELLVQPRKFDELLTKAEGILDVDKRREVMKDIET